MHLPFVKKTNPASRNITFAPLLIPLLSSLCLALPIISSAAEKLFSIESPATQEQILRHAGPKLKAAIYQPYVEEFVLAQAYPSVVAEQSNDIDITLTQACSIRAHKIRTEKAPPDMLVWEGERPNQKRGGVLSPNEIPVNLLNAVTLVRHDYNITGLVRVNGETYQIIPVENGEHAIIKIDTRKFPQGHNTLIPPDYKPDCTKRLPLTNEPHSTIRVMVPVTQQIQNRLQDIPGQVALAFSLANQATVNSGADVTFENAGIFYTNYDENLSDSFSALLNRLRTSTDPVLGGPVYAYRNEHRAHLAAMLTSN